METLILNSSKKIDEIRSIFDSYKVDINLKNLLHIEDISPNTTGILITNEFEISIIKPIVEFAIKNNLKKIIFLFYNSNDIFLCSRKYKN